MRAGRRGADPVVSQSRAGRGGSWLVGSREEGSRQGTAEETGTEDAEGRRAGPHWPGADGREAIEKMETAGPELTAH